MYTCRDQRTLFNRPITHRRAQKLRTEAAHTVFQGAPQLKCHSLHSQQLIVQRRDRRIVHSSHLTVQLGRQTQCSSHHTVQAKSSTVHSSHHTVQLHNHRVYKSPRTLHPSSCTTTLCFRTAPSNRVIKSATKRDASLSRQMLRNSLPTHCNNCQSPTPRCNKQRNNCCSNMPMQRLLSLQLHRPRKLTKRKQPNFIPSNTSLCLRRSMQQRRQPLHSVKMCKTTAKQVCLVTAVAASAIQAASAPWPM